MGTCAIGPGPDPGPDPGPGPGSDPGPGPGPDPGPELEPVMERRITSTQQPQWRRTVCQGSEFVIFLDPFTGRRVGRPSDSRVLIRFQKPVAVPQFATSVVVGWEHIMHHHTDYLDSIKNRRSVSKKCVLRRSIHAVSVPPETQLSQVVFNVTTRKAALIFWSVHYLTIMKLVDLTSGNEIGPLCHFPQRFDISTLSLGDDNTVVSSFSNRNNVTVFALANNEWSSFTVTFSVPLGQFRALRFVSYVRAGFFVLLVDWFSGDFRVHGPWIPDRDVPVVAFESLPSFCSCPKLTTFTRTAPTVYSCSTFITGSRAVTAIDVESFCIVSSMRLLWMRLVSYK